jgi:type I restriction enzyme S subunit
LEGTDFSSVITGTAQQQITRKPLAALVVPVPPVAEQERIVEILEGQFSRLDSALASVKAVREKAQAFRRSLLHAAFSGELTGGTEGWRMVAIGEVADVLNGDRGKNYPSKKFRTASGVPFVNAGHLEGASIAMSEMDFISDEHFALLGAGKFTVGDILFCIRGSLGKLALNKSIQVGAIASSLVIVRPREEVTPAFLHYFLSSPQTSSQIKQYDNGTAQPNLAAANFKRFITPLPSLATQERIVSVLEEQFSRLDNALEVANQLEARIASERRSLLHGAFTGALTATWRETHV